jgi:hypothetical protein
MARIAAIEAQLSTPESKPGAVRQALPFQRTILEEAAGNVLGADLVSRLPHLLRMTDLRTQTG